MCVLCGYILVLMSLCVCALYCCRLENHSSTKSCVIYWTIIKALSSYHQNKSGDNNVAEGVNTSNAAPATVAVR